MRRTSPGPGTRLVPHLLDAGTRKFWQVTGRRIDLDGPEWWLDHELRLWGAPAVRLHYKLERVP